MKSKKEKEEEKLKNLPLKVTKYIYNDIRHIDFKTDKEFKTTVELLLKNISDTLIDWKQREIGIKHIGGIILGNYGKKEIFYKYYNQQIYITLSQQIADSRAALMKEACRIVTLSGKEIDSKIVETSIEKMLTKFVLFKLCGSSNKVIATTCSNCICLLVLYVQSQKIIERICEQANSGGTISKIRTAEALMIIFKEYSEELIYKNQQIIEECLKILLGDTNDDVKVMARKAFLLYKMYYNEKAVTFMQTLVRTVQMKIKEDESKGVNLDIIYEEQESKTNKNANESNEPLNLLQSELKQQNPNENKEQKKENNQTKQLPQKNNMPSSVEKNQKSKSPKKRGKSKEANLTEGNLQKSPKPNSSSRKGPSLIERYEKNKKKADNQNQKMSNKLLEKLNTKAGGIALLTGGVNVEDGSSNNLEQIEPSIIKQIDTIKHSTKSSKLLSSFTFFSNNFSQIKSQINLISESTIKKIVDVHVDYLIQNEKYVIIQIIKNLNKFYLYSNTSNIFLPHTNEIVKLIITNLSLKNPEIEKQSNQLFEMICKKGKSKVVFESIIDFLKDEECDEEIAYSVLLSIVDKCEEILNDEKYYNKIIDVLCIGKESNKFLIKFIKKLYTINQESFLNGFNNCKSEENQDKLIKIAKENELEFYKNILCLKELKQQNKAQTCEISIGQSVDNIDDDKTENYFNNEDNMAEEKKEENNKEEEEEQENKKEENKETDTTKEEKKEADNIEDEQKEEENNDEEKDNNNDEQIKDDHNEVDKGLEENQKEKEKEKEENDNEKEEKNENDEIKEESLDKKEQNSRILDKSGEINVNNEETKKDQQSQQLSNRNSKRGDSIISKSHLSQSKDNNKNNQSDINNSNSDNGIPKELQDAIYNKDLNSFNEFMSNNNKYIPHFVSLLSNKEYFPYLNTLISFLYVLLSNEIFIEDLNMLIDEITESLKNILTQNQKNKKVVNNLKEIFSILPLYLNPKKVLINLSTFLLVTKIEPLIKVILFSFKNFAINNKRYNIEELLPSFIESVFRMLEHKSNDIRQIAVDCSVEVYLNIGNKFETYLKKLDKKQDNIIRLFIKKRIGN